MAHLRLNIERWKIPPVNRMRSKSFSTFCWDAYLWWIKWYYCLFFWLSSSRQWNEIPLNRISKSSIAFNHHNFGSECVPSCVFSFTLLAFHFEWTSFIIDPNRLFSIRMPNSFLLTFISRIPKIYKFKFCLISHIGLKIFILSIFQSGEKKKKRLLCTTN